VYQGIVSLTTEEFCPWGCRCIVEGVWFSASWCFKDLVGMWISVKRQTPQTWSASSPAAPALTSRVTNSEH
jgi:hypothetical protein